VIDGNHEQEDATDESNDGIRDSRKERLQDERSQKPSAGDEDEDGQNPTFTVRDRPERLTLSPDDCLDSMTEADFRRDEPHKQPP
jgi:hypothetical protein